MARIFIVDDHPLVRAGLRYLLAPESDLEICGEAADMPEALRLVHTLRPDLVIVDLALSAGSGLDLIKHLHAQYADIVTLVSSMYDETLYAERVLAAGARGYVSKQSAPSELIVALRRVLAGHIYVSEQVSNRLPGAARGRPDSPSLDLTCLSNRELTVFELVGEGMDTQAIAEHLSLSTKTIESHQANIKRKLHLNSARELTRRAALWHMERSAGKTVSASSPPDPSGV